MLINAYESVELELKKEAYRDIEMLTDKLNAEQIIKRLMSKLGLINDIASKYYYGWKKDFMAERTVTIENATPQQLEQNAKKIIKKVKETQCIKSVDHIAKDDKMVQAASIEKEGEVEMKGLKVIEEKVVKTVKVEGENGIYEAGTDKGVMLTKNNMNISFSNVGELEEWVTEFKQVFKMVI